MNIILILTLRSIMLLIFVCVVAGVLLGMMPLSP